MDSEVLVTLIVRVITDQPMTQDARGNTSTNAPEHEAPASAKVQDDSGRYLLRHPGALEESIE